MIARVQVQACGCIALPEALVRATGIGPGSIVQLKVRDDKTLELVRVSGPLAPETMSSAACPVP